MRLNMSEAVAQGAAAYRGSGATGHINNEQEYQQGRTQTRQARTHMTLSNDQKKFLNDVINPLLKEYASLDGSTPEGKKKMDEIERKVNFLLKNQGMNDLDFNSVLLKHNGSTRGGGGTAASISQTAFTSGTGSGGGSEGGGGAATTTSSDGL
jgi:uncharacterized membrane protein YgcG